MTPPVALGLVALVACSGEVDPQAGATLPAPEVASVAPGAGSTLGSASPTGPGSVPISGTAEPGATVVDGVGLGNGGFGGGGPAANVGGANSPPSVGPQASTPGTEPPPPDQPSAGYARRLTHVEYDNTVEDLLGDESRPSQAFESDVAQNGFTNNAAGQNVSPTLAEQYMVAAEALSRTATQDVQGLLGCDPSVVGEDACIQGFVRDFGQRAWRRPLSAEEQSRMLDVFTKARADYELDVALQMVLQVFLQSPQFIYLLEPPPPGVEAGTVAPLDSWEVASRLSYFILGSMPDEELFAIAEVGGLDTADAVAIEAQRLLALPRARQRVSLFFEEWLRLRNADRMQKDATMFPDFELSWGGLMQEQVRLFAQSVVLDDGGTAKDLLTAPYTFVTRELAPLYGVAAPLDDQFHRVELDPTQRAGLLTHVAVMANLAHGNQTDPVVRGKFVRTAMLCDAIPAPPPGAVINVPEIKPGSTTRERFAQHLEDPTCATCHVFMDPIGLGFEHYDPLGQWRETDNGLPVDATGEIFGTDVAGTFDGAIELSNKLADSEQFMDCIARNWLRFALGRSDLDADAGALAAAGETFRVSGFQIRELLVALTQTNAFRHQLVPDPNATTLGQETP